MVLVIVCFNSTMNAHLAALFMQLDLNGLELLHLPDKGESNGINLWYQ